jgi:hypothetical protein
MGTLLRSSRSGLLSCGLPFLERMPMDTKPRLAVTLLGLTLLGAQALSVLHADTPAHTPTPKELLSKSTAQEWRTPDPQNVLVMQLPQGQVLIELAPDFAPLHAVNIRTLAHEHYYDGLAIVRVHDNFVTQWGDPQDDDDGDKSKLKPLGTAKATHAIAKR